MQNSSIKAIIWDYDGTLVNTQRKNLAVTRQIVKQITRKHADNFPALQSVDNYIAVTKRATNWRDMYAAEYGMSPEQVDRAGWLWAEYQLQDSTPVPLFEGIDDVLTTLRNFPHGIVSQNARTSILDALKNYRIEGYFGCIIGFEEVDIRRQKPEPDGLLQCIEQLTGFSSGYVVYIGDHETDIRCAQNTTLELQKRHIDIEVMTIGACYGDCSDPSLWLLPPQYVARTTAEILEIVEGL